MPIPRPRSSSGFALIAPAVVTSLLAALLFVIFSVKRQANPDFLEKPYLQLGNEPTLRDEERMSLRWLTQDFDAGWTVETRVEGAETWVKTAPPTFRRVAVPDMEEQRVWTAVLTGLKPGVRFEYRVLRAGQVALSAVSRARPSRKQSHRFVVFGDCAADTPEQRAVAFQAFQEKPDFVFITGDIVYSRGRISEYRKRFFPVYNAEDASAETGAPLLRSTLFLSSPGNHDILNRDLDKYPDGLAYFLYWSQPLNGPLSENGAVNTPTLSGPEGTQKAFLAGAGDAYPRMANFSFDYGNAHWTVLDANPYVDWTDPKLREWLAKDLASAKGATWRFVGFHQPGFQSSKNHFEEQQMRLVSDIFEKGKVDVVFNGHVHNYQRSYPMRFTLDKDAFAAAKAKRTGGDPIAGKWRLDKAFDGQTKTKADGVIYVVTGGGGAGLYDPEQQGHPETWQPFTAKYVADTHSLTVADVDGKRLTIRQVSKEGRELDRFVLTR